jgi:hypothetical protein
VREIEITLMSDENPDVSQYIDWDTWLRCDEVEAAEQHSLTEILETWGQVKTGQATL